MTKNDKQAPAHCLVLREEVDAVASILASQLHVRGENGGEMNDEESADFRDAIRDALYVAACVRSAAHAARLDTMGAREACCVGDTPSPFQQGRREVSIGGFPATVYDTGLNGDPPDGDAPGDAEAFYKRASDALGSAETLDVSFNITGLQYDWWLDFVDRFNLSYVKRDSGAHFMWKGDGVSLTTQHDFEAHKNRLGALDTSIGISGESAVVQDMVMAFHAGYGVEYSRPVWDRSII